MRRMSRQPAEREERIGDGDRNWGTDIIGVVAATPRRNQVPFRTIATLQSWVDEFAQGSPSALAAIRVIPQDGTDGEDAGLVAVRLLDSPTEIYIEPPSRATGPEWAVTFEPREQPVTLGARAVASMAEEVAVLAALCTFLQEKSDASVAKQ